VEVDLAAHTLGDEPPTRGAADALAGMPPAGVWRVVLRGQPAYEDGRAVTAVVGRVVEPGRDRFRP
jgi:hypothetical protein